MKTSDIMWNKSFCVVGLVISKLLEDEPDFVLVDILKTTCIFVVEQESLNYVASITPIAVQNLVLSWVRALCD